MPNSMASGLDLLLATNLHKPVLIKLEAILRVKHIIFAAK